MTVGRLLREISSHEITEWHAFYKIENDEADHEQLANEARMKQESRRRG